jgi:hypothetical protein
MKLRYILLFVLVGIGYNEPCPIKAQDKETTVPIKASGPEVHSKDIPIRYDYQVPDQNIVAPESVDPGEVIIVSVSQIQNPPPYLYAATYRWKVLENGKVKTNVKEWPDGTSILFGAGVIRQGESGRTFSIVLSACYLYVAKEKDNITGIGQRSNLLTTTITVNGSSPNPGPGPTPGPSPGPSLPDGKFGLAKTAYQIAMDSVPSGARAKGAPVLANSFNGIASSVAAGTLNNPRDLLTQTKTANQTALSNAGVSAADWDNFFTVLQRQIYPLHAGGKLNSVQDFADAWREISAGLEKVR